MKHGKVVAFLAAAILVGVAGTASAGVTFGGWTTGGSWDSSLTLSGVGTFDRVTVDLDAGASNDDLDSPALDNFSSGSGWTEEAGATTTFAAASGADRTSLTFDVNFGPDDLMDSTHVEFMVRAYDSGVLVYSNRFAGDGVVVGGVVTPVFSVIPLPPAAWMGLSMLGGLGLLSRIRRRRLT